VVPAAQPCCYSVAILWGIAPPVAPAIDAANGISGGDLWDTSRAAVVLALIADLVPFMLAFGPALLSIGEWRRVAIAVRTSIVGLARPSRARWSAESSCRSRPGKAWR
jgi:TRAP-type uncharacterized transport system fused permease subunit